MKIDFESRPTFVRVKNRRRAHFLTCFLALLVYRIVEKAVRGYTCEEILSTLKEMDFADIEDQRYMPLYKRFKLTDSLHKVCSFRTDYQSVHHLVKAKKSKGRA